MRSTLVLALAAACGTTPSPTSTQPDPADATQPGTPLGDPVSATIGPDGGTLTSADGALAIIVPPGSVAADTPFSVQAITATSFSPVGSAYRLAPADLTFATPVTLRYTYLADEVTGPTPEDEIVFVAQDSLGYWHPDVDETSDAEAQTVSVELATFAVTPPADVSARIAPADGGTTADWTLDYGVLVGPSGQKIGLGATQPFTAKTCFRRDPETGMIDDGSLEKHGCFELPSGGVGYEWFVNHTQGGESVSGRITKTDAIGTYTAPTNLLGLEEITPRISVNVNWMHHTGGGGTSITVTCRANVRSNLTDACTPETWTGSSHVVDTTGAEYDSTFVFALDPTSTLPRYVVQSGEVNITKQPPPSGDCTTTIEANHAIGTHDGQLTVDETDYQNPIVTGGGTTVWLATYTSVCSNGTTTMMLPYSIAWWPLATGGNPPVTLPAGTGTFAAANQMDTGTITLTRM